MKPIRQKTGIDMFIVTYSVTLESCQLLLEHVGNNPNAIRYA